MIISNDYILRRFEYPPRRPFCNLKQKLSYLQLHPPMARFAFTVSQGILFAQFHHSFYTYLMALEIMEWDSIEIPCSRIHRVCCEISAGQFRYLNVGY